MKPGINRLKNAIFTVEQVCPGATKTWPWFGFLAKEKKSRCVPHAEGQMRSRAHAACMTAEAIVTAHPTGGLTSHPAEHTGGVPLCPWPVENDDMAA